MELASSAASVYPCGRKPEQYPAVPKRQVFRPWGSRCIPVSRSRPEPKENAKPGSTTSIVADIPDLTQSKGQNPNSTPLKDNQVQQMTKKKFRTARTWPHPSSRRSPGPKDKAMSEQFGRLALRPSVPPFPPWHRHRSRRPQQNMVATHKCCRRFRFEPRPAVQDTFNWI